MAIKSVKSWRNPYYSNKVANATFTVGTETTNTITVAVQLQNKSRADLAERGVVQAWLSKDAAGDVLLDGIFMPESGYAIGTDGTLLPGPLPANRIYPTAGLLAIDATAEKFKLITNTVTFFVGGSAFTKAPATAIVFSAAHTVTASKFGVVLVQVTQAGVVSTKVPAATQAYNTAALALAALPSPDANNVALGYIAIANNAGDWVANTDDLTNGSDLTTATFVNAPANGLYPSTFTLISEADGDIDLVFTETRALGIPFYLHLRMPDGGKVSSGAIAFA